MFYDTLTRFPPFCPTVYKESAEGSQELNHPVTLNRPINKVQRRECTGHHPCLGEHVNVDEPISLDPRSETLKILLRLTVSLNLTF